MHDKLNDARHSGELTVDRVGAIGVQVGTQAVVLIDEFPIDRHHLRLVVLPRPVLAAAAVLHQRQEGVELRGPQEVRGILGAVVAAVASHVAAVVAVAHPGGVDHLVQRAEQAGRVSTVRGEVEEH